MMISVHDSPKTWEIRLATGKLSEREWQILREMVASGQADTLEEAARIMDFLEREQNLDDTFQSD